MKIMSFVGRSGSGKTTLLEQLIADLTGRGLKVGSIKHHSHIGFDYDVPGKDSARFFDAGSLVSLVAAPDKIGLQSRITADAEPEQLIEIVKLLQPQLDILIIEGYKQSNLPTIEIFRADNPKDANRQLEDRSNLKAVITDIEQVATDATARSIPTFKFDAISQIADFIVYN